MVIMWMVIMMMCQLNGAGLPNTLRGGKMIVAATAVSMAASASLGQMVKVPRFEDPWVFSHEHTRRDILARRDL